MKHHISEAEQSQAFTRGFQPDLWHHISHRLEIKLPNHDPDDFYPLFKINKAAKHVLHDTSQNRFLQSSMTSTTPPTQPAPPYIKVEDLLTLFEYPQSAHAAKVDDKPCPLQHQCPSNCKGTSVCFLTSSLLYYSPPVYIYSLSSPLYHLQGLHLQPTTSILIARQLHRHQHTRSQ
jgi:hypothetical protein